MASKSPSRPSRSEVGARRARAEQMRREQQAKERRARLLVIGIGALVVVLVAALIGVAVVHKHGQATAQLLPAAVPATPVTKQNALATVKDDSGIPGVVAYDTTAPQSTSEVTPPTAKYVSHDHVAGTVQYSVTPPVGGPHNATWMTCGVYTAAVPSERAVHDLEHGAVWITYRPSLPASQVKALRAFAVKQSDEKLQGQDLHSNYMDLTPWTSDALPSPIVISSWGRQLRVDSPTDPRLQRFVDKFRLRSDLTYEAGAQCTAPGGDVQTGGRPSAT